MANGVNKVILIGNLGRDPQVMTFDNGVKKASFSIATTETYKSREGTREEIVEWHNIVLWRGLAEVAEKYLQKGNQIYLEGRIRTRQYEDKEGNTRYITEIEGQNMTMLGGRRDQVPEMNQAPADEVESNNSTEDLNTSDDDLPF